MPFAFFRRLPVVHRRNDRTFELLLRPNQVDALDAYLGELDRLLDETPDDDALRRLHPPAYLDDPDQDLAYQLLAGDELRDRRREAIATTRQMLHADVLDEAQAWTFLRAVNGLRLVIATRLGIDDEEHEWPEVDPDHPDADLWVAFEFVCLVEDSLVTALGS